MFFFQYRKLNKKNQTGKSVNETVSSWHDFVVKLDGMKKFLDDSKMSQRYLINLRNTSHVILTLYKMLQKVGN